ncbi:MAG: NUDIX hydrolase [Ferruginibacter sp.]
MSFEEDLRAHYLKGHEKYLRHISVDCIIFGFHDNELKTLLLHAKYAGDWALPGFILKKEHMYDAAKRILKQRTGWMKSICNNSRFRELPGLIQSFSSYSCNSCFIIRVIK